MRDAWVRMKDGKTFCGPIWMWRPKEGWFSLIDGEDEEGSERILFDDVLFGHLPDDLSRGSFLARAIEEGWEPKISKESYKKVFEEVKTFVLQNKDEVNQFLIPSFKKAFGETLKAQQFVGVIETKSGYSIEILPKLANGQCEEEVKETRKIFIKML